MTPVLTLGVVEQLHAAAAAGERTVQCSLDLQRSLTEVQLHADHWRSPAGSWPYPQQCRERTVYFWSGSRFEAAQRYGSALVKLVPTPWGPPTFEIDGIKMLPSAHDSPWNDARAKVALIEPRDKVILDTCAGLGYFAAWCLQGKAREVLSFEKNADVLWLRGLNPWSPPETAALRLTLGDVVTNLAALADGSVDAILHDPPRFGTAGELYAQSFYAQLARVLRRRGRLFHYTGAPNRLTSNRDVPREVATRLQRCGFTVRPSGDGLLAIRT